MTDSHYRLLEILSNFYLYDCEWKQHGTHDHPEEKLTFEMIDFEKKKNKQTMKKKKKQKRKRKRKTKVKIVKNRVNNIF